MTVGPRLRIPDRVEMILPQGHGLLFSEGLELWPQKVYSLPVVYWRESIKIDSLHPLGLRHNLLETQDQMTAIGSLRGLHSRGQSPRLVQSEDRKAPVLGLW